MAAVLAEELGVRPHVQWPLPSADGDTVNWLGLGKPGKSDPASVLAALERWLQTPMAAAACDEATGYVPICDAVSMCAELRELTGGALAPVAEAVRSYDSNGPIACSEDNRSVRLRGLLERVRTAAEDQFATLGVQALSLLDLLRTPTVEGLLRGFSETSEQLQTLCDALGLSQLLEVQGSRVVSRQAMPDWWPQESWPLAPAQLMMRGPDPYAPWNTGCAVQGWEGMDALSPPYCSSYAHPTNTHKAAKHRREFKDRREWLCTLFTEVLENPPPDVVKLMDPEGSVSVSRLLAVRTSLAERVFYNADTVIRAIQTNTRGRVTADSARQTIRLKTLSEQLLDVCEGLLSEKARREATSLGELLMSQPVQEAFARAAASSSEGESTQAASLRLALAASDFLEVTEEAPGLHMVRSRPPEQILCKEVEELLGTEPRARVMLSRDGEAPLSWVAEHPSVAKCLARAGVRGGKACLEALRGAVDMSTRYMLDEPRMSVLLSSKEQHGSQDPGHRSFDDRGASSRRSGRFVPADRDARKLRELLAFYFELFNLQHNHVLMAVVEEQRHKPQGKVGYLRSSGQRPLFSLRDLLVLPRLAGLFDKYDADAAPLLLAAALQAEECLPVRVCAQREPGAPRGAWATSDPRLELTYVPDLRFLETRGGPCAEVMPLLQAGSPNDSVQPLPSHALCVVSYSVSSDLSHSQSPKAAEVAMDESIDPGLFTWDCRQRKIKRQLLMYDPDIICVQGLQSIGFAERCSEWEPGWFCFEDEPALNHLVHLYREVSKANYGVAFTPTMKLPGSSVVCFGNAVFWKRSRWQMERQWSVQNTAVCAELTSRSLDWRIAVCSAKSAAVYAKEWGDKLTDQELAAALQAVQESLSAASARCRPLWCGDFGAKPTALLPELLAPAPGTQQEPSWQSACTSVLGEDPWTSVSTHTAHEAVDAILHDGGLRALGALCGPQSHVSLASFLKSGYPSDHLLQLAVFVDAEPRGERKDGTEERPHGVEGEAEASSDAF